MRISKSLLDVTVKLTASLSPYRFVSKTFGVPAVGGNVYGVTHSGGVTDELVTITLLGAAIIETGSAITAGASVQTDAIGRAVPYTDGIVLGVLAPGQSAGQAGDLVEVILHREQGGGRLGNAPRKGRAFGGKYGRRVAIWESALTNSAGTAALVTPATMPPIDESQTQVLQLTYNATASFGQKNTASANLAITTREATSIGLWANNPGTKPLAVNVTCFNVGASKQFTSTFRIKPTNGWEFFTLSGYSIINNGAFVFGTDLIAIVRVAQSTNAITPWTAGDTIFIGTVYVGTKGRARFMIGNDDGTAQMVRPFNNTDVVPASGRSYREIVENYGFKGTLYIVPELINTSGYMNTTELLNLYSTGWAAGSHSHSHAANAENAGLRLLGPYGYYMSNAFDNLDANYKTIFGINSTWRRRLTGGAATGNLLTTENAHKFIAARTCSIVFTDVAPTGLTHNTRYYVA